MSEQEQILALRKGNTALISALMSMVGQFFYDNHGDEVLTHSYMSAEEEAIDVLLKAGFAEEVEGGGYRLLWEKLSEREASERVAELEGEK